jgi:hypothetical protein
MKIYFDMNELFYECQHQKEWYKNLLHYSLALCSDILALPFTVFMAIKFKEIK